MLSTVALPPARVIHARQQGDEHLRPAGYLTPPTFRQTRLIIFIFVQKSALAMDLKPKQLEIIRNYFAGKPVLKAYLFGSFVRGEATEESDIDLMVELDYDRIFGLEFVQMQMDLENLLNKKIDLVSVNGLSKYIAPIIHKEKRLVYAR